MPDNSTAVAEQNRRFAGVLVRAWTDAEFKSRLLTEPANVLSEAGLEFPPGERLHAVDITEEEFYLVLRPPGDMAAQPATEEQAQFDRVIARAGADPSFRQQLFTQPTATLTAEGIAMPPGTRVIVLEPDTSETYLFVPPVPKDLDIEPIGDDVAGFFSGCSASTAGCSAFSTGTPSPLPGSPAAAPPTPSGPPGIRYVYDPKVADLRWKLP